jgi:hypothetical protein
LLDKRLGYRSAVAWAKDRWVVPSPREASGSDGPTAAWERPGREGYDSVGFAPTGEVWAIGPKGRVVASARDDWLS